MTRFVSPTVAQSMIEASFAKVCGPKLAASALASDLEASAARDYSDFNYALNHAPMTLTALHTLAGLSDSTRDIGAAARAVYVDKHLPALGDAVVPVFGLAIDQSISIASDAELWGVAGNRAALQAAARYLWASLEGLLQGCATAEEQKTVVAEWLTRYLGGNDMVRRSIGCGAAHALLRIAFGLDAGSYVDVASGVAMAITNAFPTPIPATSHQTDRPGTATEAAAAVGRSQAIAEVNHLTPYPKPPLPGIGGIDQRCLHYFEVPDFKAALPALGVGRSDGGLAATHDELLRLATSVFSKHHDFSALHVFTGAVALRTLTDVMAPVCPEDILGDIVNGCFAELLAIVCQIPGNQRARDARATDEALSAPSSDAAAQGTTEGGETPIQRAAVRALTVAATQESTSSVFEHLVKLAYSAVVVEQRGGDRLADDQRHAVASLVERECASHAPF